MMGKWSTNKHKVASFLGFAAISGTWHKWLPETKLLTFAKKQNHSGNLKITLKYSHKTHFVCRYFTAVQSFDYSCKIVL